MQSVSWQPLPLRIPKDRDTPSWSFMVLHGPSWLRPSIGLGKSLESPSGAFLSRAPSPQICAQQARGASTRLRRQSFIFFCGEMREQNFSCEIWSRKKQDTGVEDCLDGRRGGREGRGSSTCARRLTTSLFSSCCPLLSFSSLGCDKVHE